MLYSLVHSKLAGAEGWISINGMAFFWLPSPSAHGTYQAANWGVAMSNPNVIFVYCNPIGVLSPVLASDRQTF
jgi:hypothetical protein